MQEVHVAERAEILSSRPCHGQHHCACSMRQLAASASKRHVLLPLFLRNSSPRSSNRGHTLSRMNFTSKYS